MTGLERSPRKPSTALENKDVNFQTRNCGKFLKTWEYQTTWPASWETYMQVKKQHLETDME